MSLQARIEAIIYASDEPVTLAQLAGLLGKEAQAELDRLESQQGTLDLDGILHKAVPQSGETADAKKREHALNDYFRMVLARLASGYALEERGIEIREVAGGFRMATKLEYHDSVRGFIRNLKPPLKLTIQALETLAVVAYKQPITAPEVSGIRGVDCSGVLGSLVGRKLVTTAGRKSVIGRPILYRTTKDFLLRFGLKDVSELPSIEEFEKLAGEFTVAEQKEMEMGFDEEKVLLGRERDAVSPQGDGDSTALNEGESVDAWSSSHSPSYVAEIARDPSVEDATKQSGRAREVSFVLEEFGAVNDGLDTVRTPEGDNENAPDAPLQPGNTNTDGLQPWPAIDTNDVAK